MYKFLKMYNLSRWNQEEIENVNRLIISNKINSVIQKKIPKNKSPGLDVFTGKFYKIYKEKLTSILLKLFPIIAEGMLPNSFSSKTLP